MNSQFLTSCRIRCLIDFCNLLYHSLPSTWYYVSFEGKGGRARLQGKQASRHQSGYYLPVVGSFFFSYIRQQRRFAEVFVPLRRTHSCVLIPDRVNETQGVFFSSYICVTFCRGGAKGFASYWAVLCQQLSIRRSCYYRIRHMVAAVKASPVRGRVCVSRYGEQQLSLETADYNNHTHLYFFSCF